MSSGDIIDILAEKGLRLTRQRKTIINVIARNDGLSCKDICFKVRKADSTIGVATVYRMIRILEDEGVIERVDMIKHIRSY